MKIKDPQKSYEEPSNQWNRKLDPSEIWSKELDLKSLTNYLKFEFDEINNDVLINFELLNMIGRGGFGEVNYNHV